MSLMKIAACLAASAAAVALYRKVSKKPTAARTATAAAAGGACFEAIRAARRAAARKAADTVKATVETAKATVETASTKSTKKTAGNGSFIAGVVLSMFVHTAISGVAMRAGMKEHRATFLAGTICAVGDLLWAIKSKAGLGKLFVAINAFSYAYDISKFVKAERSCTA